MLTTKFSYDINKFDFRKEVQSLFEEPLEKLTLENAELLTEYTDQNTDFHTTFYSRVSNTKFYDLYKKFIKEEIQPKIASEVLYQKIPTFRVQSLNNLGVGAFHKDSDYSHSKYEINIFLPLTEAKGNATIWVAEYDNVLAPLSADYG